MPRNKIFIIVPAYNEVKNLPSVLAAVTRLNYSVIVVDDGSEDATFAVASRYPVTLLRHAINLGYYETLKTGIKYALSQKAKVLVFFDADGQHPSQQIALIVSKLQHTKSDLVIGSRFTEINKTYSPTALMTLVTRLFSANCWLFTGRHISDTTSGFQALTAKTAEFLYNNYISLDFPVGNLILLLHQGFKVTEIPVTMQPRQYGKSMHQSAGYYLLIPPQMLIANLALLLKIIFSRITK